MQARKQLTHSTAHTGKKQDQITKKNKGKNKGEEKKMKAEHTVCGNWNSTPDARMMSEHAQH